VQFQRVSWCNGLFVDRFKRRDWGGERELISAHARLGVADRFAGKFADAPYFINHERWPWKLAVGEVDGEPVVVILRRVRTAGERYRPED
jgi:RNA polymerase sigma-70 factor, ECF subfamily